jgi:ornithine cyclodeaminase
MPFLSSIPYITADEVRAALPMPQAIEVMRTAFAALGQGRVTMPVRTGVRTPGGVSFFMPGYIADESGVGAGALAQKIVSVYPGNASRGLPVINALVTVLDAQTGAPRALIEGTYLTALRTGAVTGLATDLLAAPDAKELVIFGAGGQAEMQVRAVCAVRPIERVRIISRSNSTQMLIDRLTPGDPFRIFEDARGDVEAAVRGADVIVTVTGSTEPLFDGAWVRDGAHVNAVGAYRPDMREVDAALLNRAAVVVDQREAALHEAGDLLIPAAQGEWLLDRIAAELADLVLGRVHVDRAHITLFKSCGLALEDIAAAQAVLANLGR